MDSITIYVGEAKGAYKATRYFKFCFILLLLSEVMRISDILLRKSSQDDNQQASNR
jgi:hypothetical protein